MVSLYRRVSNILNGTQNVNFVNLFLIESILKTTWTNKFLGSSPFGSLWIPTLHGFGVREGDGLLYWKSGKDYIHNHIHENGRGVLSIEKWDGCRVRREGTVRRNLSIGFKRGGRTFLETSLYTPFLFIFILIVDDGDLTLAGIEQITNFII